MANMAVEMQTVDTFDTDIVLKCFNTQKRIVLYPFNWSHSLSSHSDSPFQQCQLEGQTVLSRQVYHPFSLSNSPMRGHCLIIGTDYKYIFIITVSLA